MELFLSCLATFVFTNTDITWLKSGIQKLASWLSGVITSENGTALQTTYLAAATMECKTLENSFFFVKADKVTIYWKIAERSEAGLLSSLGIWKTLNSEVKNW